MAKYSINVEDGLIRIYITGLVHLMLKKKELIGFMAWMIGDESPKYRIEFYLKSRVVFTEYDTPEKWKEILRLLDRGDLCEGFEE